MPAPHVHEVLGQQLLVAAQDSSVAQLGCRTEPSRLILVHAAVPDTAATRTSQWVTPALQVVNQPNRHDQEGPR